MTRLRHAEWTQYLDAAGYPRASVLPPAYRNPPSTPLVALEKPRRGAQGALAEAEADGEEVQQAPPPQPLPSDPSPSNPLGIRF